VPRSPHFRPRGPTTHAPGTRECPPYRPNSSIRPVGRGRAIGICQPPERMVACEAASTEENGLVITRDDEAAPAGGRKRGGGPKFFVFLGGGGGPVAVLSASPARSTTGPSVQEREQAVERAFGGVGLDACVPSTACREFSVNGGTERRPPTSVLKAFWPAFQMAGRQMPQRREPPGVG